GSHYLVETGSARILLDCGMYQGGRELRDRNWQPFPVPPQSIDAVVLSHAHIDHTGYLPRLIRDGFEKAVHATAATRDLCDLLLPDSARLMEEEAEFRNRKGATRHDPALPLYTEAEAHEAVRRIVPVRDGRITTLPGGTLLTLHRAGHILGSSLVELGPDGVTLLFTGDLGRRDPLLLRPPQTGLAADYVMVESTYGDRRHAERDPRPALAELVRRVAARSGVIVIPAFAVGRTQEVLFILRELEDAGAIPRLPVAVDSPMATDVTALFGKYPSELEQDVRRFGDRALCPDGLRFTRSVEESKALNAEEGPAIIISASGMATGGRVLHHLKQRLPDPRNAVLLVGHQVEGTRGYSLLHGAKELRIFKQDVPVRAEIANVDAFSAHADTDELLDWLRTLAHPPKHVFLIHGEDPARAALATRIQADLGWQVSAPAYGERVEVT
ncbi:MAG: MBL fold metallo-hydrolase RNA specificity domain-containing protein, partial [Dehalococcoidia bacterium]